MEHSFWHDTWKEPEQGFNQPSAHPSLGKSFPKLAKGSRVLVPLCGKSIDMLWLAEQGYSVTGVELVESAVAAFFEENSIAASRNQQGSPSIYHATHPDITIVVGDFFAFSNEPFDALYDRAALVALPESMRADYINHCIALLKEDARIHLVVFDYDTSVKDGPPFALPETTIKQLWNDKLSLISTFDMLAVDSPFKESGFKHFNELVYQC